jgi:hypothetical protein
LPYIRVLRLWKENYAWNHKALHDKYGPVVRVAPNLVTVTSTQAVHEIYGSGYKYPKSFFYSMMSKSFLLDTL